MSQVAIPPIGARLRVERQARGVSLRALARAVGVSASLISQIETGRIQPSVSTLYTLTGALGLSVADLLKSAAPPGQSKAAATAPVAVDASPVVATAGLAAILERNPVTNREIPLRPGPTGDDTENNVTAGILAALTSLGTRETVTLDSGVMWEVLGKIPAKKVDFLRVTYEPGSASSSGELMRHPGIEYAFLLSGALQMQLGDEERSLAPDDAVCFHSEVPHRFRNEGDEPAVGIWVVVDEV